MSCAIELLMFVLYEAMQKTRDFDIKDFKVCRFVFEYCPRGYIKGGYYFSIRPSTAGIIRVRVLFEGGSYLRKYGS